MFYTDRSSPAKKSTESDNESYSVDQGNYAINF